MFGPPTLHAASPPHYTLAGRLGRPPPPTIPIHHVCRGIYTGVLFLEVGTQLTERLNIFLTKLIAIWKLNSPFWGIRKCYLFVFFSHILTWSLLMWRVDELARREGMAGLDQAAQKPTTSEPSDTATATWIWVKKRKKKEKCSNGISNYKRVVLMKMLR